MAAARLGNQLKAATMHASRAFTVLPRATQAAGACVRYCSSAPSVYAAPVTRPSVAWHTPNHGSDADNAHIDTSRAFAVVAVSGSQYKVTPGDLLCVDHIPAAEVGKEVVLDQVLLAGTAAHTLVGRPVIPGARVVAMCEEHTKERKVLVFKKKRRKGFKKTRGSRRSLTLLRIMHVEYEEPARE